MEERRQVMNLRQLAQNSPQAPQDAQERAETARIALTLEDKQAAAEEAQRLKESLLRGLEAGEEPQTLLYRAISCIAAATFDREFEGRAQGFLDAISADLAQQSMFVDEKSVEAQRRQEAKAEYLQQERKRLIKGMAGLNRIAAEMKKALEAIEAEQHADNEEWMK